MRRLSLAVIFLSIPALSMGSALLGTLSLNAGSSQQVAVGLCSGSMTEQCIDFDYTGGTTTNSDTSSPLIATGTVDGTGDGATFTVGNPSGYMGDPQGSNVIVADLNSTNEPAGGSVADSDFIQFSGKPWTIELTTVDLGGDGSSGCVATTISTSSNQFCSPPTGPFNEENYACSGDGTVSGTACQVDISFAFTGIANDGSGNMSTVTGTFSTTFSGTNFQSINTDIADGEDVVTSDSGSLVFRATATTPEPMSSALVGAGLLLIGLVNRKRLGVKR